MTDKELREYGMIQELGESGQYNHLVSWFGDMAVYEKASGVDYRDIEAAYNQLRNQEHVNMGDGAETKILEVYITNLRKYNEGELIGEWVKLPVSIDEYQNVLGRIGIKPGYEEVFITDYDVNLYEVSNQLGEFESLGKLNYLAGVLANLSASDREKYEAVLESGISVEQPGIDGLINLAYNLERYDLLTEVKDEYDLGRYYAKLSFGAELEERMGELANYIDFEGYGSDCQINEGGMFTDAGYMKDTGEEWNKYFDGSLENIPEKYRLPERKDDLSSDRAVKNKSDEWEMER